MTQHTWALAHVNAVTPQGILKDVCVYAQNGKIVRIGADIPPDVPVTEAPGAWALPGLVDLHIHGSGGFGPEQGTPEALWQMSDVLAQQGVAAFCPTLYCAAPTNMANLLRAITPALGKETGAQIIGFHLEGPFISSQKPGVMKPQDIAPADLEDFKKIYEAAQGKIAIVTLAPELPGIEPIIEFCLQHKIVVQAGHTNATFEQMQAAFEKGVRRVTHWGNAMSGAHQRAPGVFGAALINPEISCELIADGKHVHPAWLELLRRVKPLSQITAVTDALLPTGQAQAPFYANAQEVELKDAVWKRKSDGVTAGSALTMLGAVRQLIACGYTLQEALAVAGTHPAYIAGITPPALQPGADAFVILATPDLQPIHIYR